MEYNLKVLISTQLSSTKFLNTQFSKNKMRCPSSGYKLTSIFKKKIIFEKTLNYLGH